MVQTIPFVKANREVDARSCHGTAIHASDASQSLSHPVKTHPYLTYLLWDIADKAHKYNKRKIQEIYEQTVNATRHFSRQKSNGSSITIQGQIACFAQSKPSRVVAGQSAVQQTPCERRLVLLKMLFRRCRLHRRLLETENTPAPGLCS